MKIATMKRIDHRFGLIICLGLDFFERAIKLIRGIKRDSVKILNPKNILITKYFGLGSLLFATPMIRAIRQKFPRSRITLLTFSGNRPLLDLFEDIDDVFELRTENFFIFSKDLFRVLCQIWREKIDIVFDLEFFSKFSTMVAYLSGARVRVGYYMRHMWRGELLTHQVYYNCYKHISEVFLALARSVGADTDNLNIAPLHLDNQKKKNSWLKLIGYGIKESDRLVSVNVNASELCLERKWPAEDFITLVTLLATKYTDIKFIFIGSRIEKGYVDNIFNQLSPKCRNVINLTGQSRLEDLIVLLGNSLLFIGNDSGPLHLAEALNTPTVSFFGPETPSLYGPRGREHIVFYKGLYCSPCLNIYNVKTAMCGGNNKCMQAITVEEVVDAVCRQLDKKMPEKQRVSIAL